MFTLCEFQKEKTKRIEQKVYLKQLWVKTPQTWGEKQTSGSIRPKRSQIG